jgi:hypothetical protein
MMFRYPMNVAAFWSFTSSAVDPRGFVFSVVTFISAGHQLVIGPNTIPGGSMQDQSPERSRQYCRWSALKLPTRSENRIVPSGLAYLIGSHGFLDRMPLGFCAQLASLAAPTYCGCRR